MCVTFELRFPTNQQVSSFFSVCVCLLCVLENSFTFRLKCRKCHYNSSLFLSGRISFSLFSHFRGVFCFCVPLYSITFGDMRQISSQEAYCLLWMSLFVHFRFLNSDILLYNVLQRFSDIIIYKISIYWYILKRTSVVILWIR